MDATDIKLYPHNQETYLKIESAWETTNRVASIQATGTGKSFLILKSIFDNPNINKVVFAPSSYILEQLENQFKEELPNTQLITYAKLSFMSDEEIKTMNPQMIFLDEFHRCGAEMWSSGVQKLLDYFPNIKVLGTSATPIRFLDDNRNMAEELFDGNIVTNLSLAEAIAKKILPMPTYVSALYTFSDELITLKNKVRYSRNTEESKAELLTQIEDMKKKLDKSKGIPKILGKYISNTEKLIVFCKDTNHLEQMRKTVANWFTKAKKNVKVDCYTAYSNYNNSSKEILEFQNNKTPNVIKLLFSVDMFNEGIHIEDVTGVILLRPTVSPIIYYQQIGRSFLIGNANKPIILDFVNNFDNIGAKIFIGDLKKYETIERKKANVNTNEISEFVIYDEILDVKELFQSIDNRLIDDWDAMYYELENYWVKNGNTDIVMINPTKFTRWVSRQRTLYTNGMLSEERIKLLKKFNFVFNARDKWDEIYESLVDYLTINKCNDLTPSSILDKKILNWIKNQKQVYKKGNLSENRIQKLDALNINWKHSLGTLKWEEMFNNVLEFKKEYGHIVVPQKYKNGNLNLWINLQINKNNNNELNESQVVKLKELGVFDKVNYEVFYWNESLKSYIEYTKEYNSYVVDKSHYGSKAYNFYRRIIYDLNKNSVSADRLKLLQEANFPFPQNNWMNSLNDYIEFIKTSNRKVVKLKDDKKLNGWFYLNRNNYRKGKLSKERIDLLNQVDFPWE